MEDDGSRVPFRPRRHFLYFSWHVLALTLLAPFYIIPVLLYRALVVLTARLIRPDLTHLLQGHGPVLLQHAVHTHTETGHNQVVAMRIQGVLDMQYLKFIALAKLSEAKDRNGVLVCPEFQEYCVKYGGYFFWKRESNFCIDDHVTHRRLTPQDNLDALRTNYVHDPLPKGKSPWQVLAIDGLNEPNDGHGASSSASSNEYLLLFKFHHSLADGFSLLHNLLNPICNNEAELLGSRTTQQRRGPSTGQSCGLLTSVAAPFRFVATFTRLLWTTSPGLPWPSVRPQPFAGAWMGGRREGNHWAPSDEQCVPMETVKAIARAGGVSVSAATYAALAGGLRSYLISDYGADKIPSYIRFPQIVPVPRHPAGLCNKLAWVTFRLPVGQPDPRLRLLECEQMLTKCKESMEGPMTLLLNNLFSVLPAPLRRGLGFGPVSVSTSNMPGPLSCIYFNVQPVLSLSVQVGNVPVPFYLHMMSYNGWLRWTCNGDRRVFKSAADVTRVGQLIREEFISLADLAATATTRTVCNHTIIEHIDSD